jgi:hypothetical protein
MLAACALAAVVVGGGAGCKAPTATPSSSGRRVDQSAIGGANDFVNARVPEVLDDGNEMLKIAVTETEVVLTSDPDAHDYDEITYIITLDDDPAYNLQATSAADREEFEIRVSFKRLYRGTYTVKAYGDKGTEPIGQGSLRVTEEGL